MNKTRQSQLRFALWIVSHLHRKSNQETFMGDLMEGFQSGRSSGWLWRQVLIAIAIGFTTTCLARWREVCFALCGTLLMAVKSYPYRFQIIWIPSIERVWAWGIRLGWPLSSIYDFGFVALVHSAVILMLLFLFLVVKRTLSFTNMLRAVLLAFPLLVIGQLATIASFQVSPVLISYSLYVLPCFLALLVSACASSPLDPRIGSR